MNEERHRSLLEKLVANALVPLARTWGQRDELQRKIESNVDAVLASDGDFEAAFKEALEGKTATEQELAFEERRQAIAHLLFNLSDNFDGQGVSVGLLNQNLGQGSLQPLLILLRDGHPQTLRTLLGPERLRGLLEMLARWQPHATDSHSIATRIG